MIKIMIMIIIVIVITIAMMIMMIKIILMIAVVIMKIVNSLFQPGDLSSGFTTDFNEIIFYPFYIFQFKFLNYAFVTHF